MRKQWRKAKKEEAERTARLHSAANGPAHGFPLSAAAEHSSHHHHLAQHSSLPDLHQQAHHLGHGHAHSLSFSPAYQSQPPMYRQMPPQQLQPIDEYGQPLRRHSMHTVPSLPGFPPQHQLPPPQPHSQPHVFPSGVHTLQHSLSNASLSSTSHSLSPPHDYAEPPQQQVGSYGAGWSSRAESQGWEQPQYQYEAHHGPPSVYEQPRAMYGDNRGSLAPDSTLLAPLDVPGYAPAVHHDDR